MEINFWPFKKYRNRTAFVAAVLIVKEEDVIVVAVDQTLTSQQSGELKKQVQVLLRGHQRVLILDKGARLTVIKNGRF